MFYKDIGFCRVVIIIGIFFRIFLNDDEEEKGINFEGLSYLILFGNVIFKVII